MPLSNYNTSSYSQILKSSAIVGGAQGIDILISMVRIKVVALLLGPSGVGLIGLYQSAIEVLGKISGLGIRSSGVRQVAEAHGTGNDERLGRTVKVLQRACWITGLFGWLLTIALARPLSLWVFDNSEKALALALLGSALLITCFAETQSALLQGFRRIADLARVMVFSSIGGTLISISLYAWLGARGIVPALLATASITLAVSWWFSRRVTTPVVVMKWRETAREARPLISLGLAFMWSGILTTGVAFAIRGLIIRDFGIDASGFYQAAWGISGLFAGFILHAMSKDFYPRLTAVAHQNNYINQLVNEQAEVGILLALPGLLATIAFSPLVIQVFYTAKFITAAEMLPWFVIGVFGRVISWPLGFIQLAKGASITYTATETAANALHLFFVWVGLRYMGIVGVAVAFAVLYGCYTVIVFWVAVRLSGFRWSRSVVKLIVFSAIFIGMVFGIINLFPGTPATISSLILVLISGIYCLRQLVLRLGPEHRISKLAATVPGVGRYFQA